MHGGDLNVKELAGMNPFKNHDINYDKIGANWSALNGVKTEMAKAV